MATENERWGYTRIRDAIENLGHEISRDTVANILKENGIEPAPERGTRTTWADFLKRQWDVMAATDLFTVEVWSLKGIIRYHVLFVIRLATREVQLAGIARPANGLWMAQIARNLTDGIDGFLKGDKHPIHDRDPLFTDELRKILRDVGIDPIQLPRRSPNLNTFAERFVGSIKRECLNQMIFFSESSVRYAIGQYLEHYHEERNHQGLESKIIRPQFNSRRSDGATIWKARLGGLLNCYIRQAA